MTDRSSCRVLPLHAFLTAGRCPTCGALGPRGGPGDAAAAWDTAAMVAILCEAPERPQEADRLVADLLLARPPRTPDLFPVLTAGLRSGRALVETPSCVILHRWGRTIMADDASSLEDDLRADPSCLARRFLLLNHYARTEHFASNAARCATGHVLWLLEYAPQLARSDLLDTLPSDPACLAEIHSAWRRLSDTSPADAELCYHGAILFTRQPADAEFFVERGYALEPDHSRWLELKGGQLLARSRRESDRNRRQQLAAQAVPWFRRALRGMEEPESTAVLVDIAHAAFAAGDWVEAGSAATELVQVVREEYDSGGSCYAWHWGHTVLGLLALQRGDGAQAADYLRHSAEVEEGSPTLRSYGPTMSLARELLRAGLRDPVIRYLERCASFWKTSDHRPERWAYQIRQDQEPDWGQQMCPLLNWPLADEARA